MKKIQFSIVTPERTVYSAEVDQVTLPVEDGDVTILPDHISYIATLKVGEIIAKVGNEEFPMAISSGFLEFNNNTLVVLVDVAERAEEIDLKLAEEARARAEEVKKQVSLDENEYARVAATLEHELARTRVARRYAQRRRLGNTSSGE
jgi:F-type H+-transporting ATPase subunit epsilon